MWSHIDVTVDGCWLWTGARLASGYGSMRWQGKARVVHRVMYELEIGPIPGGLQIDHLCRVRPCCNPAHLEPVTHAENLRRGRGFAGLNAAKDRCPAGHAYTPENTYTRPSAPTTRECILCRRANRAAHYLRERAS